MNERHKTSGGPSSSAPTGHDPSAPDSASDLSASGSAPAISASTILARAAAHGLSLTSESDEVDGMGLDFVVVHARDAAGTPWVVRCPRRQDVVTSAAVEAKALAFLAPHLPVAIPEWRLHTNDVIAYPRLPGTPALTMNPDGTPHFNVVDPGSPSDGFVDSVATFLAALQGIDTAAARAIGVPVRSMTEVRSTWAATMMSTRAVLAPSEASWARWQRWLANDEFWPTHVTWSHGDLHPGHMLLNESGRMTGVLDWTEAAVGDPGVDLAMFYGCFGAAAFARLHDRFVRAGGRVWPGLSQHVAEQWFAFPAHGAAWAMRTNNPGVLEFARNTLRASEAQPSE
ncbi:MAG TPA: macrolide 2'-phosphotransferase [Polyangia bacterium]